METIEELRQERAKIAKEWDIAEQAACDAIGHKDEDEKAEKADALMKKLREIDSAGYKLTGNARWA